MIGLPSLGLSSSNTSAASATNISGVGLDMLLSNVLAQGDTALRHNQGLSTNMSNTTIFLVVAGVGLVTFLAFRYK